MLYFNNPTVANPLAETIADGERIITAMMQASSRLQDAIRNEREAYGRLTDMREMGQD